MKYLLKSYILSINIVVLGEYTHSILVMCPIFNECGDTAV